MYKLRVFVSELPIGGLDLRDAGVEVVIAFLDHEEEDHPLVADELGPRCTKNETQIMLGGLVVVLLLPGP